MPSWILAIDFGTSYTVAAAKVGDRAPEIVEIAGERRMPSVVLVDPEGDVFVGRTAEDLSITHPGSTLRALKNRLGEQTPAILGGRPHQVVTLVAALLREVYEQVVVQLGEPPAEVRLTHPATWNQPRINRLIEAAAKAGLPNPLLVPEPVAAALSYAADVGVEPGRPIVVYDLGGGTFDSAVVTARNGGFTVVGRPGGDQHIGGELFDELLVNHIGATLAPDVWEAIQVGDDPLWRQVGAALRNEARKAKEALSSHPYVTVLVPLPNGLSQVRITRDDFHALVRPYIAETVETLRRCVAEAGVQPDELAGISLVGGSSRSPIVEEMVREAFPMVPISRRGDPKATVAAGATLADRPSSSAPGLWRSPVTQEASPGTAQQRVRLAPPPVSEPPGYVQGASPRPPTEPPVVDGRSAEAPPTPPPPARPAPPPPPGPGPRPERAVVIGGHLQPEPDATVSRTRLAVILGLIAAVVIAVVVVVVTRDDDSPSSADGGPGGSAQVSPPGDPTETDGPDATEEPSDTAEPSTDVTETPATDTASTETAETDTDPTASADTDPPGDDGPVAIGTPYGTFSGHDAEILSADFSPDGQHIVTASLDGTAIVWNLATGSIDAELIGHTDEVYSAAFSPDGLTVATTGADTTVRLWDAADGTQIAELTGHTAVVYQVRFSPDGGSLLTASADGTARLWDIASQSEAAVFTGATEALYFAEFSPSGEQIIGGGQDDNALLWSVFDAGTPIVLSGHTADVQVGEFSPDGSIVMTGSDDARIRVWNASSGALIYDLGNIEGGVDSVAFSHDGARLMASGKDDTAALWDVASGQLLGDLGGHDAEVYSAVFSADDSKVVTASADGTAKVWDVSPGTPIGVEITTLKVGAPVIGAILSDDDGLIATVDAAGNLAIWAG